MVESAASDPLASSDGHATGIDAAIRAFEAGDPPDDRALAVFITEHASRFSAPQRQAVQRLVTWPVRGPGDGGADLGMTALVHFADSEEVAAMWSRWIRGGAFDGTPCSPAELAHYLVEALRQHVAGTERLDEALRTHVRAALRSGDVGRINTALTHVEVTARAGAPIALALVREAHTATGSTEWRTWTAREPDAAERLRIEVEEVADATARRIASATCGAG
ncbi:MAG: hypothetical protein ABIT71_17565 [Vicinamibacteraceae bacterium]